MKFFMAIFVVLIVLATLCDAGKPNNHRKDDDERLRIKFRDRNDDEDDEEVDTDVVLETFFKQFEVTSNAEPSITHQFHSRNNSRKSTKAKRIATSARSIFAITKRQSKTTTTSSSEMKSSMS